MADHQAPAALTDPIAVALMDLFTPAVTKVDDHVRAVQDSQTALLERVSALEQGEVNFPSIFIIFYSSTFHSKRAGPVPGRPALAGRP